MIWTMSTCHLVMNIIINKISPSVKITFPLSNKNEIVFPVGRAVFLQCIIPFIPIYMISGVFKCGDFFHWERQCLRNDPYEDEK